MAEPWEKLVPPGGPWFGGTPGGTPGEKGEDGREVELRKGETHVQWRYVGEPSWQDLVALADLKGDKGDPGEPGADGADGANGADGREVELQKSATHIQWRYEDDGSWPDLVALADLEGEKGDPGEIPDVENFLTAEDLAGYVTSGDLSSALAGKADTSHTHTASNITDFNTAADARIAASTTVVKTTGNQTVGGTKTFSSAPSVPDGSFSIAKVSGLQTALNGKVGSGNSSVTGIEYYDSVEDLPEEGTPGVIYVVPVEE